jgi:hypothetical protein
MTQSFPFPNLRSNLIMKEVYTYNNHYESFDELLSEYSRKISSDALSIRNQYLYIEEELFRSFQFVQPINANLNTTSVRFASIIREAANLFEIISRTTYQKLFEISQDSNLNIHNFLSLDYFLSLSEAILDSPTLETEFKDHGILQPFKSLESWDKQSAISPEHVPTWWKAYNKLKHDIEGINEFASMENSILAVGALYLIISRIYGEGVVGGILRKPLEDGGSRQYLVPVSKLFVEDALIVAVWG